MKTDLYTAAEAAKVLNQMKDRKLGSGILALKVFDTVDALGRKAMFLEEEMNKIFRTNQAVPMDAENGDLRMVVKNEDGTVDEEKTTAFIQEIVDIRKTEVDLDIEPFTMDELDKFDLSPADIGKIRFLIQTKPEPKEEGPVITLE